MENSINSENFALVSADEQQQGNSAGVFYLGQIVWSGEPPNQQQPQQRPLTANLTPKVAKTEQKQPQMQQQREKDEEESYGTMEVRQRLQMSHFDQLMKTCETIVGQMTQLQNDLNAILGRIGQLETQQQQTFAQKTKKEPKVGSGKQHKKTELPPSADSGPTKPKNFWDAHARHPTDVSFTYYDYDLEIIDKNCLAIQYKKWKYGNDWLTVFAKNSIQSSANSNGLFYFEIAVESLKAPIGAIIGVAVKHKPFLSVVSRWGTFACQSNGIFWANGCQQILNGALSFGRGDVFGCGVHLATRQMFLTKNGHRLVTPNLLVPSSTDRLFPFVSLVSPGDQIEANFGPNFLFVCT